MSEKLTDAQLTTALAALPGWTLDNQAITKAYTTAGFADAVALLTRMAFDAEAADHHPDLLLEYRRLTVRFWTHTAGGVTQKDIDGANAAERLAAPFVVKDK